MPSVAEPVRILLVEDSAVQARYIQQALSEMPLAAPFEVACVDALAPAMEVLAQGLTDLVLLDLVLPDSEGTDTLDTVHGAYPDLPIVILSGFGDEETALAAVADGAEDYLSKRSLSPDQLARSIRYAVQRHRRLQDARQLALVDELTGVYNRRGVLRAAEQVMGDARRIGRPVTGLLVDVDGLKTINDTFGHGSGDEALREIAELMTTTFRQSDVVGRLGGDEFCAVLLDEGETSTAADRLLAAIDRRNAEAHTFRLSCSIGVVTAPQESATTVAALLALADSAMYQEKRGRSAAGSGAYDREELRDESGPEVVH